MKKVLIVLLPTLIFSWCLILYGWYGNQSNCYVIDFQAMLNNLTANISNNYQSAIEQIQKNFANVINGSWQDMINTSNQLSVIDFGSFFVAVGNFFVMIGQFFSAIAQFMFYGIMAVCQFIYVALSFIVNIIAFFFNPIVNNLC